MEQVILNYLEVLGIPVSKTYFRKQVASLSEYPSILSVADTLERLGIEHVVARIQKEDLEKTYYLFICYINVSVSMKLSILGHKEVDNIAI